MEEESDSVSVTSVGEGDGETWTFVNSEECPINEAKLLEDSDNCSDHGSDGSSIVIVEESNTQVNSPVTVEESALSDADVYEEGSETSLGSELHSPNIATRDSFEISESSGLLISSKEEEPPSSYIEPVEKKCENKVVLDKNLAQVIVPEESNLQVPKEADLETTQEFDTKVLKGVSTEVSKKVDTEVPKEFDSNVLEETDIKVPKEFNLEALKEPDTEVSKVVDIEVSKEVDVETSKEVNPEVPKEFNAELSIKTDPEISNEAVSQASEKDEFEFPVVSKLEEQVSNIVSDVCKEELKNPEESTKGHYNIQDEQEQELCASHHDIPVNLGQVQPSTEPEVFIGTVGITENPTEVEVPDCHLYSESKAEIHSEKEISEDFCSDNESLIEELMDRDDLFENSNEGEMLDDSILESDSLIECSLGSSNQTNLESSPSPIRMIENPIMPTKPDLLHEASHLEEELDQLDYSSFSNPDLPAELNIANIFRERHYVHHPNQRLNIQLTYFVAFVMAAVIGFALGHIIGLSDNFPSRCPALNQMNTNPELYKEWTVGELQSEVQQLTLLNKELNRALKDFKKKCRFDVQNELKSENLELKHTIGTIRYGKPICSVEDKSTINQLKNENEQLRTLIRMQRDEKETNLTKYWKELVSKFGAWNTTKELNEFVKETTSIVNIIELRHKEVSNLTQQVVGDQMAKELQSQARKLLRLLKDIFIIDADETNVRITDKDRHQLAKIRDELESNWNKLQSQLKTKLDNKSINNKSLNADWFLSMGRQREKIRREERQTEWMFDRARKRQNERNSGRFRGHSDQLYRRFNHYTQ